MLVYFNPDNGELLYTLHLTEGITPPVGHKLTVPDQELDFNKWRVFNGTLQQVALATANLKAAAKEKIATRRKETRLIFVTDIPGQDALYTAKYEEAVAYAKIIEEGGTPNPLNFPLITSEVGATAPTSYEVALVFIYLNDLWRRVAGSIDGCCFQAQVAVDSAVTLSNLEAVEVGFEETILEILSQFGAS